jgi:membrane-bound lytic murein transglycosylase D
MAGSGRVDPSQIQRAIGRFETTMSCKSPVAARRLLGFVLLSLLGATAAGADATFPRPPGLEPNVRFWIRIYSEVDTRGGLIHDSRDLRIVYHKIAFSKGQSSRSRERQLEARKKEIAGILRKLARGHRSGLSTESKRILALFPNGVSNKTLKDSATRVRFQLGQADKFRAGMVRSGEWRKHIRDTFREMNLPTGLASLPHVESSFTPTAYSRVGAAGLWQFTRSTGRRYMRVDHVVDERLDPYSATRSAGQLLAANKLITGTWPLAITAYNHGASGMRRATRKLGTTDIEVIVRRYKSRTFGFASRNFYVEFLAARQVETNASHYFGKLELAHPVPHDTIELPFYVRAGELAKAIGVSTDRLRKANPALSKLVWSEDKFVPRGYTLRVPVAELPRPLAASIEAMPSQRQQLAQTPDRTHRVRRGDTLSGIAARYGTSVRQLAARNKLRSRNRIRVGQVLRLPNGGRSTQVVARATKPANGVYKVRRGDSISRIATRFGMSEGELLSINNLRNRNRIYPGQSLRVSGSAARIDTPPARPADREDAETAATTRPTPTEAAAAPAPSPEATDPTTKPDDTATPSTEPAAEPTQEATPETEPDSELVDRGPFDEPAAIQLAALSETSFEAPERTGEAATSDPTADATHELARDLQADPADYSVAEDGTVEIQEAETLGHIAEWLDVRASRLRQLNGLRYGTPIETHRRLELDFSRVARDEFERRRLEHHRALQIVFFERFEITGTRIHVIRRGDSIWNLSRSAEVPSWLLQQYNPDLDIAELRAGAKLTIPELRRHGDS